MKTVLNIINAFKFPILVLIGLVAYLILMKLNFFTLALFVIFASIALGSWDLSKETIQDLKNKHFALDYIAILAVITSIITQQYLAGAVVALMLATGRTLEDFGSNQAKETLGFLAKRIPHEVLVKEEDREIIKNVKDIKVNEIIKIRKGEVIPLDGALVSDNCLIDESSLTGEPYPANKKKHDFIRSGTINLGNVIEIKVTRAELNSTYRKIVEMVEVAEKEKAPLVRLADQYSLVFTIITFIIATIAFLIHRNLISVLAVLVVATPCPLILATPIALLGGVNAAAKKKIIIKKLASLEILSRVNAFIFDKTGTITLGKPKVVKFKILASQKSENSTGELLGISEAIERNTLHPLGKAIVDYARSQKTKNVKIENLEEEIGQGISATFKKNKYTLSKIENKKGNKMEIGLFKNKALLAIFDLEDEIKGDSRAMLEDLQAKGISVSIFTGDKKENAENLVKNLGLKINIRAECKPEDKLDGLKKLKLAGKITAMVGDGINDAPALAASDVGMVFLSEEQNVSSEAADVVFLGNGLLKVKEAILNAQKTIKIAKQSIIFGIGLSIVAMIFATAGFIPPITGAILQEGIDAAVILNALRAAK